MKLLNDWRDYSGLLYRIRQLENPVPALRDLCKHDLFFLLRYGLNRADVDNDWLFKQCRMVQASPNGHLDLWSREHYKSTIITFAKTIQDILNNPNITVGIFSHTRPIAKGFLRQIKLELETNNNLKQWFDDILFEHPHKQSPKWSEDDGIIIKRPGNPKEATVEAWGLVDGQPIGKHYSLLIYDDIVVPASVSTPDMIHKTTEALAMSYNLGAIGGHRRFIGTRYHFGDTYAVIMERGTVNPRVFPATHDGTDTGDPVFMPQSLLDDKRRDMGPYVFACQMLQNPVADKSQGFAREWIRYYDVIQPQGMNWYMLIDAANGKRKHNDYTSIWMVGLNYDGNMYCIPEVRDRINPTERANRIIDLHRKYRPIEVRYEEYGMQSDIEFIKMIQEKQQYRFDIISVGGSMSKPDRMKRMIPLFENSKVWLPVRHYSVDYEGITKDLVHDFINQELLAFPVMAHDDMLDCLARINDTHGKAGDKAVTLSLRFPVDTRSLGTDDAQSRKSYNPIYKN